MAQVQFELLMKTPEQWLEFAVFLVAVAASPAVVRLVARTMDKLPAIYGTPTPLRGKSWWVDVWHPDHSTWRKDFLHLALAAGSALIIVVVMSFLAK